MADRDDRDERLRDDAALIDRLRSMSIGAAAEQLEAIQRLKRAGAGAGAGGGDRERPKPDALDLGFDAVRFALDTWARWKREIEGPQIAYLTRHLARAAVPGGGQGGRLVVDLGDVPRGATGRRKFRVENPASSPRRVMLEPLTARNVSGVTLNGLVTVVRMDGQSLQDFEVAGRRTGLFEVMATPAATALLGPYLASATVIVGEREAGMLTLALRVTP